MRTLMTGFLVLLLGLMMPLEAAHAKRLGGGFSLGKSYTTPKKVTPAPGANRTQDAQKTTTPNQTANTTRRSGWGGMLGGLLAGGLLGALLFGGGFEGIQLMDILLIALVAFVLFKLFARKGTPQPVAAGAGTGAPQTRQSWGDQATAGAERTAETPVYSGGIGGGDAGLAEAELNLPDWFNKEAFLSQACDHFARLQKAWDESDWEEIATYTTAELLAELKAQRARFPQRQHTEVVSVMAELANFIDEGSQVIVSIHFYGWLREEEQADTAEFSEIWHLSRDRTVENADWFIVGIDQPR